MIQIKIFNELDRNKNVFESLLKNTEREHFLWKETPDKWCLLEVVCHLLDEEREDFRARVKLCLESPDIPFSPIDPVGWVLERKYLDQKFDEKLEDFLNEREDSIKWLRSLADPRWENAQDHKTLGKMSADMFLSNWLAHDYIHIRQIIKIKYAYLDRITDHSLQYAGNW